MSSISGPKGRQPASVYRRRRLVVLLALAAIVTLIVLVIVRPGSASGDRGQRGDTDNRSAATGAPSGSATPGASGSAKPGGSCAPDAVTLVAITDATAYAAGAQPQLSMSITNSGTSPCTFDVGTGAQDYTISSGAERIWDSKDCQTGPTTDVRTLDPGSTLTTQPFTWDRTRSSTSTCDGARQAVVAGGASYHLAVAVGDAKAEASKQFILN